MTEENRKKWMRQLRVMREEIGSIMCADVLREYDEDYEGCFTFAQKIVAESIIDTLSTARSLVLVLHELLKEMEENNQREP